MIYGHDQVLTLIIDKGLLFHNALAELDNQCSQCVDTLRLFHSSVRVYVYVCVCVLKPALPEMKRERWRVRVCVCVCVSHMQKEMKNISTLNRAETCRVEGLRGC